MSLRDMERRIRDREHPPSPARLAAQQKQLARGNAPWQTRKTEEEREDRCWDPLTGLEYRAQLERKLARLKDALCHGKEAYDEKEGMFWAP
jgi:hypothetical protein